MALEKAGGKPVYGDLKNTVTIDDDGSGDGAEGATY